MVMATDRYVTPKMVLGFLTTLIEVLGKCFFDCERNFNSSGTIHSHERRSFIWTSVEAVQSIF